MLSSPLTVRIELKDIDNPLGIDATCLARAVALINNLPVSVSLAVQNAGVNLVVFAMYFSINLIGHVISNL